MNRVFVFILLVGMIAAGALIGCSSDPDSPLGAEFVVDSLILSEPGEVFVDTFYVSGGEFTWVVDRLIGGGSVIQVGVEDGYQRTAIMRFDFTDPEDDDPGSDTTRTVQFAELRLQPRNDITTNTLQARFYEVVQPFSQDDTIATLELADTAIMDDQGVVDRLLENNPTPDYRLDPALVQRWIRATEHNGLAIVENEGTTNKVLQFTAQENSASDATDPFVFVWFTDGTSSNYTIMDDGTYHVDNNPVTSLPLSDAEVRRVWLPIDLSGFDTKTLLHDASLTVSFDTMTTIGSISGISLYTPGSSDPDDPDILDGDEVGVRVPEEDATSITFNVRVPVEAFLADSTLNNGFVLRFSSEGASPRRVEFFDSTSPIELVPSYRFIFSGAATFPDS